MIRVTVKPELLQWARERAGGTLQSLSKRFPRLQLWERGEAKPTLKQLEAFAKVTYVPFGYFFLPEPPEESLPIPDLRTICSQEIRRSSPDLLDTIYSMQRRQAWLREELVECEAEALEFVGSARLADEPQGVGREMRRMVGLDDSWASTVRTWKDAVAELRRAVEKLGVMAIINGVVGNNTHRKLDIGEFRGFALSDEYAPLVFVIWGSICHDSAGYNGLSYFLFAQTYLSRSLFPHSGFRRFSCCRRPTTMPGWILIPLAKLSTC